MANILEVIIKVKDDFTSGLQGVNNRIKSVTDNFKSFGAMLTTGIVAIALKKMVADATESEQALIKLNSALKAGGNYSKESSDALVEYAQTLAQVTTYSDDAIISAEALLATFQLTEPQIKAATRAVLDMSAATGTDLHTAAMLVGKAMVGETAMLTRYGIIIDKSRMETEGFVAVLDEMKKKFGGTAEAIAKSGSGGLEQFKVMIGEVSEDIGKSLIPALNDVIQPFAPLLWGISKIGVAFVEVVAMSVKEILFLGDVIWKVLGLQFKQAKELSRKNTAEFADFFIAAGQRINDAGNFFIKKDQEALDENLNFKTTKTKKQLDEEQKEREKAAEKRLETERELIEKTEDLRKNEEEQAYARIDREAEAFRAQKINEDIINRYVEASKTKVKEDAEKERLEKTKAAQEKQQELTLKDLDMAQQTLTSVFSAMELAAGEDMNSAKSIAKTKIAIEQGLAVAKIWASVAGAGPLAPILAAAQTALIVGNIRGQFAQVDAMAKGGIVTSPRLALIGEAGPEAVIPLSRTNTGMSSSAISIQSINIQFPNVSTLQDWIDADPAKIKEICRRKILVAFQELDKEGIRLP